MANIYKNAGINLSTTNLTTLYTVPSNRTAILKTIQVSNEHASNNLLEVSYTDSSASVTYEIYHKSLASGETINAALGPIVLESGDILKAQCGVANTIEGIISYLEIFDEKSA
jgi:hypothetical protein